MAHDVIVIGGGVVGCSIAYRLSKRGRRVLLIERRALAAGASGRNGGMTGAGSSMHAAAGQAVYALTSANLALLRQLSDELEADFSLRLEGSLDVATTQEQLAHLKRSVAAQRAAGLNAQLLGPEQARSIEPELAPDILGAEFMPDRGHLWPFALVLAFADAARQRGAEFRLGVEAQRLLWQGDRAVGVDTGMEQIFADEIVLATNAYTQELLPWLPDRAIVPARAQILVSQPLGPLIRHPFGTNFDKEYGRQTPGGQIVCGGYRRLDVGEGLGQTTERVTPSVLRGIATCLTTLFPRLHGSRFVRAWAGIMGFTADGLPMIGRYAGRDGLTLAVGFNGGGFSWAAIVGQVVANLLDGGDSRFNLAPFAPDRFATGGAAWSNPFTAGERSHAMPSDLNALS